MRPGIVTHVHTHKTCVVNPGNEKWIYVSMQICICICVYVFMHTHPHMYVMCIYVYRDIPI